MYDAISDPYCYKGTTVLKNVVNLRTQDELDVFEHEAALARSDEPLPAGALDVAHYQAVHHHLFQDVYDWAGEFRTVRISKGGSMFCYPEHILGEMSRLCEQLERDAFLQGLDAEAFAAKAAHFIAELNAIHPFREGNGRTQLSFLAMLADHAGHPLNFDALKPDVFLAAVIRSFGGDEEALKATIFTMATG